jgi:hypothetical protein
MYCFNENNIMLIEIFILFYFSLMTLQLGIPIIMRRSMHNIGNTENEFSDNHSKISPNIISTIPTIFWYKIKLLINKYYISSTF